MHAGQGLGAVGCLAPAATPADGVERLMPKVSEVVRLGENRRTSRVPNTAWIISTAEPQEAGDRLTDEWEWNQSQKKELGAEG
jgi:hypothetical protein